MMELAVKLFWTAVDLLNGASAWLVFSYVLAGLLHHVLSPDRLQRMLGNRKFSSILKAAASGLLLPICSCGVIPIGLGLYYSGAYLGPTLAFMTATPILNPAAVLLTYGFLGPQITVAYIVTGIVLSLGVGVLGNWLAGSEIHAPGMDGGSAPVALEAGRVSWQEKLRSGLTWGFQDLGAQVSKYVCIGIAVVSVILTLVPRNAIHHYLGEPGFVALAAIAVLGAIMYVCAVGHIPFIAVLVASGAAPGLAVTFLISGAATNIPELISIYKLIGRRAMLIYLLFLTGASFLAGYLTNVALMPGFTPAFDLDRTRGSVNLANKLLLAVPEPLQYICSAVIVVLAVYALWPQLKRLAAPGAAA